MSKTLTLLKIGLKQISRDGILFMLVPAPIILGLLLKLAIPFANGILESRLSFSISPWYGLADGFLICITPMFTAMISAFTMLDEHDEGLNGFYQITPAAGYPYLTARIGIPMIWAFLMTLATAAVFKISNITSMELILCSIISALAGTAFALMTVAFASNRVEGLAISKLMGVSLLGIVTVTAIPCPYNYLTAFLPSFWIGNILTEENDLLSAAAALPLCAVMIFAFANFLRKKNHGG